MADLGSILFRTLGYTSRRVSTRAGSVRVFEGRARRETLPTIALVHGLSADAFGYLPLLQRLRRHARVVAIDLPGHGGSESREDLTLHSCVAGGVEALASHLREPAIVFGNSLGGLTSIRFALAHPTLVRGLFVASPAGAPSSPAELESLLAKFRITTPAEALAFVEIILHEKPKGPLRHLIARDLVRRHKTPSLRALIKDVPNAKPFQPAEIAHLAPIPTHFFWGRSERLLPPSHLEFWKKNLQNATIEEPYGFGHSPQLDSPGDLARRVIAFARDH
jgi:pimeloyl-ACP methyl ester carboxylesterase